MLYFKRAMRLGNFRGVTCLNLASNSPGPDSRFQEIDSLGNLGEAMVDAVRNAY